LLAGYANELRWMYPISLLSGAGTAVGGWYFYSWAVGAGAIRNLSILGCLAVIWLTATLLFIVPLAWPLRLWRSLYALTTERVIIRQPSVLIFWPRTRSLDALQVAGVRITCIRAWLPDRTGDIAFGRVEIRLGLGRVSVLPECVLERVPHAEDIVALIRRTFVLPPGTSGEPAGTPGRQ
jgi:hypothetical protein